MIKSYIKEKIVRPLFETFNYDRYSRPSINNLDMKLEKYLDFNSGTFLEIGANDGIKQSNTYYFEKLKKWKGILIEPIPVLYDRCKKNRKHSEVFNFICGEPDESGTIKTIRYADLMSQVDGAFNDSKKEENHIRKGIQVQNLNETFNVEIKCRTLSEIINISSYSNLDFMSIDVEGYESQVLKGLKKEHFPKYLLIEIWPHEEREIKDLLESSFKVEDQLTERDILFKRK